MRVTCVFLLCSSFVFCLTIFKPAAGQEDGPPRVFSDPRPSVTAEGQGYTYTWCEYTPYMTCYDTTVSTAVRPMDGPARLAVPVPEDVNYIPLLAVILFSIINGVNESLRSAQADAAAASAGFNIITTTPSG